nr:hypothetical protein [Vallitaleaceae bacterium]
SVYMSDGTLNDAHLQEQGDILFKQAFKDFFSNYLAIVNGSVNVTPEVPADFKTDEMLAEIAAINTYIDTREALSENHYAISVEKVNLINFSSGVDTLTIGDITSKFEYQDITDQTLSTDIIIKEPDMQYPLKVVEEKIRILNNPLWQNALVTNDDILLSPNSTGTVTISGDLYALGTIPATELAQRDPDLYGGIEVNAGTVILNNGDLVSASYLQVSESAANLIINDGNAFVNSLVLQGDADGGYIEAKNTAVYTKDDIELNAPNGDIIIDGPFFGFSNGSTGALTHDKSSSIIVNYTSQERTSANITISGDPINQPNNEYATGNDGIHINGTAYVNRTELSPYQTGESMAIATNYMFYRSLIDDADIIPSNSPFNSSNVTTEVSDDYLYFTGYGATVANFDDKANYFKTYYDTYGGTTAGAMQFYNDGWGDGVNISINSANVKRSLGLYFTGGVIQDNIIGDTQAEEASDEAEIRYNYYTMFLSNVNEFERMTLAEAKTRIATEDVITMYSNPDPGLVSFSAFDTVDYYDYGKNGIKYVKELAIINYDSSIEIVIGPDEGQGDLPSGVTSRVYYEPDASNVIQGIIVSAGPVKITQDNIDFVGTIIADGQITVNNSGDSTFIGYSKKDDDLNNTNEEKCILKIIKKYPELESYFAFEPLLEAGGDDIYNNTYRTISFIYQEYIGIADTSDSNRDRYNQLIYFDNWTID